MYLLQCELMARSHVHLMTSQAMVKSETVFPTAVMPRLQDLAPLPDGCIKQAIGGRIDRSVMAIHACSLDFAFIEFRREGGTGAPAFGWLSSVRRYNCLLFRVQAISGRTVEYSHGRKKGACSDRTKENS